MTRAMTKEMSLACQLFDKGFCMVFILEQDGDQLGAKFVGGQGAAQLATDGERNNAGLFREHDDDGVGFVAEAESGAMSQAEIALQALGLGEGKDRGSN